MKRILIASAVVLLGLTQAAAAQPLPSIPADAQMCQQGTNVYVNDGRSRVEMRSIVAQTRTAARAMGFGGVGQYAVLPGATAMYRMPTRTPTFYVAAPSNIQPQGLITLASFETRRNGTREVLIGGGYYSYSSGIAPQRVIQTTMRQAASQAGAGAGMTLYEITPAAPLPPGEYALVVSVAAASQNQGMMAGATGMGLFYDFGID
jgi:hypothetical protein